MNTQEEVLLRLYIIGNSPNAFETVNKLMELLDTQIHYEYKLEVVDILKYPEMTIRDKILASPTLIKVTPPPSKRVIGSVHYNIIAELGLFSS